jgi:TolB-like protein
MLTLIVAMRCTIASGQTAPANTILVLPFTSQSSDANNWIGKAVQQDLLADLTQATHSASLAPANAPASEDQAAALKTGRDFNATYVVFGQSQSIGKEVRLTGQVLDVAAGKPLGALKATGASDELFHLEDAVAGQVLVMLPRMLLTDAAIRSLQAPVGAQQGATAAAPAAPAPVDNSASYSPPPDYSNYPPSQTNNYSYYVPTPAYSYDYGTPVYDYGYPGYYYGGYPYYGFGIGFGFFGSNFDHHHGDFHNNGGREWNGRTGFSGSSRGGFSSRGSSGFGRSSFSGGSRMSSGFRGGFGGSSGFHSAGASRGGGGHR